MHSDLFAVELWSVTSTTDIGLGVVLQVTGPLATGKVILSKSKHALRKLGFGEESVYDTSVLVKNIPVNEDIFGYLESEPWLYLVVTDIDSGWYGRVFRIEGVIPSHARRTQYQYHTVAYGTEMESDKVWYEGGSLRAKS